MITDLHCSEVAYWEDPKSLITGLFQAVPRNGGEIAIESTGNGTGNYYHRQCMRAYEGKSRFRVHFFNWLQSPEYRVPLTEDERAALLKDLNPDLEEDKLYTMGLTLEQIAFRREKLDELDYDLRSFKQEYPITLDECFQASGFSFFSVIPYEPHNQWERMLHVDANLWALTDTYKHTPSRYAIGVDVGGGVRRDRSVIEVVDINSWEQVAEWVADTVSPDILARKIIELGRHYRDAYVTVETNNHGAVTLLKLREGFDGRDGKPKLDAYPDHLIYKSEMSGDSLLDYGFKTTQRTKPILIGSLRKEFLEGFKIHSPATKDELSTFAEDENGKLAASEGCFDDRVMALAVCVEGAKHSPYIYEREEQQRKREEVRDPFNMELQLKELRSKAAANSNHYPIPFQDAGSDYGYFVR
jgi:hypothetical protein